MIGSHVVTWDRSMEPIGFCVVAIGVFDGVHVGHQALVGEARTRALRFDVPCVAVTFDRDPDQVLTPQSAAGQLITLAEKTRFLHQAGADKVLVIPFTQRVAALEPRRFLDDVLTYALDPMAVVVGHDFRFGNRARGDVSDLEAFGRVHRFSVVDCELIERDGVPITSTRIRSLVSAGEIEFASELLGRPHRIHGTVKRGRGQGRQLGFPTANIAPLPYSALPGDGVYAALATVGAESWPAAVSIGVPPTFPQASDVVEVHLIGFEGDVYDHEMRVEFLARVRDQVRFDSEDALVSRIREDVAVCARIVAEYTRA